jgi:hypothetical protein
MTSSGDDRKRLSRLQDAVMKAAAALDMEAKGFDEKLKGHSNAALSSELAETKLPLDLRPGRGRLR